jgi:hypothetical protein|nr:MAG TPA: hypothetical protein [Caudoviricetes sp.]
MLSKSELVSKLNSIVESAKLSKSAKSEFDELLQELTQRKAREVKHADYFDEKENCVMRYCKYHCKFEREDEMIAKKSYCRAASFISNQRRNEVKRLEDELLNLISQNADSEKISELANVIREKKEKMHDSATYDYERDNQYYRENCKIREKKQDDKE